MNAASAHRGFGRERRRFGAARKPPTTESSRPARNSRQRFTSGRLSSLLLYVAGQYAWNAV
jgi:hypothetical protein